MTWQRRRQRPTGLRPDESRLSLSSKPASNAATAGWIDALMDLEVTPMPSMPAPSQAAFLSTGRDAFLFLASFGFSEVPSPAYAGAEFELWYQVDRRFVMLKGEGYGTGASVLLATADRRGTSYHGYVPVAERSMAKLKNDQLAIVRAIAGKVAAHAQDFLDGTLSKYETLAKTLPPYQTLPRVP